MPAVLLAAPSLGGEELDSRPAPVQQVQPEDSAESGCHGGPFFFENHAPGQPTQKGFRPFFLQTVDQDLETDTFLYPLFIWRKQGDFRSFSLVDLINDRRQTDAASPPVHNFDLWPFYFSHDTGQPATSYQAFFPLGGTIKERFGKDRIHFVAFPLYLGIEKAGQHTTYAPWPFLRFIGGAGHHGFEFWPVFGHRGRAGDYDSQFYVWPLFYKSVSNLAAPQPTVNLGALPFYARDTGPGYISETYAWPFFGYTHRTEPYRYDEQRYLWPLLVQARGDQRYVNRWAPVYTHSIIKGTDKTWALWPLFRRERWQADGVAQEKSQLFFFVYWSLQQHSLANPGAAPAHKTHLWPLLSSWDNGAGRRQLQLLSPLEVFFPHNDTVRQLYSPFFALYRYDRRSATESCHALLWDLVTYRRAPAGREFHLGPLFSTSSAGPARRIALGNGVLAWSRRPDTGRWKISLFDFHPKPANKAVAAALP